MPKLKVRLPKVLSIAHRERDSLSAPLGFGSACACDLFVSPPVRKYGCRLLLAPRVVVGTSVFLSLVFLFSPSALR